MDDGHHANSSWPCFWEVGGGAQQQQQQQQDEMEAEHLKQALLRTTLELESTRLVAQEELKKLEAQSLHLAHLLQIATRERDEARHHCHSLLLHLSKKPPQPDPIPNPNLEESSNAATPASSSSSESSKVSSPAAAVAEAVDVAVRERGLPEKGRLVEAVMRAGPLLQTLLLAGPLPQWRHPPPAMQSFEIPPVSMGVNCNDEKKKRKREEGEQSPNLNSTSSSSPESSKHHQNHHHHQRQQFGCFRA